MKHSLSADRNAIAIKSSIFSCLTMDRVREGWFSEVNDLWPGQAMSLQVDEVLLHEKSKFQDVMVFKR